MPASSQAINSALDGSNNLIVRFSPGLYKKKAASGYPEVYLPNAQINRYVYAEYMICCVGFQGGYSGSPIPEHSYVYFRYETSPGEIGRLQGHPYVLGVPCPGASSISNIFGVNMLTMPRKTGQTYQEYTSLSRLMVVYSSDSGIVGTVYEANQTFNLNSGVHMLAKL